MGLAMDFGIINYHALDDMIGWDTAREWFAEYALRADEIELARDVAKAEAAAKHDLSGVRSDPRLGM